MIFLPPLQHHKRKAMSRLILMHQPTKDSVNPILLLLVLCPKSRVLPLTNIPPTTTKKKKNTIK